MKNHIVFIFGKQLFLMLALFLVSLLNAASQDILMKSDAENYPPVSIPNTEMRVINSKIMNQQMDLYIRLPLSYYSNPQKIYQAWYFTDANRSFPMVANIESLFDVSTIKPVDPEIIIIGIGYKISDMSDWAAWRARDLTPTNVPGTDTYWSNALAALMGKQQEVKTGGAAKFIDFIVREVFPFMESNYRVSPAGRGIGGYSYGGLFTLYVLFKQPNLFENYYAGSPSINHDNGILFNYEEEYASTHKNLKAKLFMSAGGAEDSLMISNMNKMAGLLQSRNYPDLIVETYVFPDESHQSCYPSSIMRAFRVLYKR
jgi:predicted alpha/beta superfamily hydrolase